MLEITLCPPDSFRKFFVAAKESEAIENCSLKRCHLSCKKCLRDAAELIDLLWHFAFGRARTPLRASPPSANGVAILPLFIGHLFATTISQSSRPLT